MDITLNDLEKYFEVQKEDAALLFVFLTLIPPGNSVNFLNGRIDKISEDTLKLCVDDNVYRNVSNDFIVTETTDEYDVIFNEEDSEDE